LFFPSFFSKQSIVSDILKNDNILLENVGVEGRGLRTEGQGKWILACARMTTLWSEVKGMYEITVEKHFDAAHYLRGYKGKCESMHGHRYTIKVKVSAKKLNEIGLAYDFTDLKRHLDDILARYDHICLNDVKPFDNINPSAENIASAIYNELKEKLSAQDVTLTAVEAWETPEQGVSFRP
jgi:6-pyruvoyltetrahydropterin/6-carboxytetrahydropterin synthase